MDLQALSLHAGTGGAKSAAAPDCSQPNKPSAQPLRRLSQASSRFQQSGASTGSLAPGQHSHPKHRPDFLRAPSFAAAPIWHASLLAGADNAQGLHSMTPTAPAQRLSKPVPPSPLQQYAGLASLSGGVQPAVCNALHGSASTSPRLFCCHHTTVILRYLFANVGAQPEPAGPSPESGPSSALTWYGNLSPKVCKDKIVPAAKAPARAPNPSRQRLRDAYAAYAAMAP